MRTTEGTPLERAIGLEIQNEANVKRLSHKEIQRQAGMTDRSFRRWFVSSERHIPFEEIEKVAAVLGIQPSVLMRRAEAALPRLAEADAKAKYQALMQDKSLTDAERDDLRRAVEVDRDDLDPPSIAPSETGT